MNMDSATKSALVVDLAKVFVIALTYHLFWALKNSSPVLTENFFFEAAFLLAGVVLYYVVVAKYVNQYNEKNNS
jgi:uncharacterized membrane protein YczE